MNQITQHGEGQGRRTATTTPAEDIDYRAAELARLLAECKLSFATAESCTGGQLAAVLAGDAVLGPHLERGFVVYSADAKCELLGVGRDDVERCEAVNSDVAAAMAEGALKNSRADVAIAITGFCGPRQGDEEVGLVHLASADRAGRLVQRECHFGELGRRRVLDSAVAAALGMMIDAANDSARNR
ncbi:CinA family protein [Sphingopyxis flava]|uniref:Nicotinamide-nucleotide amidase n=1 Tax=Sphingopyxis flava TaxID=1507287 RepID=A0A1T5F3M3_9SPHN|nr:nicotinamide-nucleotide amidase [Sphingopyxis flava]